MSNTKSKMSFGNILLSILLLGTLIVIGLIVLVYFQLTDSSQRTTNTQIQNTSTQPPQTVSILLPDGSEKERRVIDPNHNQQSASQTTSASTTANQDADNIANSFKNDHSEQLNSRALTGGNIYAPHRPRLKPKHDNNLSNNTSINNYRSYNRSYSNRNNNKAEVPIEPNNTMHERPLQPKNSHQNSNTGEQPLTPIKPKKQSESIDALF